MEGVRALCDEHDILLILDEILSVGDVRFQKKSGDKLKSMMNTIM